MKWRLQISHGILAVILAVAGILGYSIYCRLTLPTPEERLNLAIGVYNYTATDLDQVLEKAFASQGIRQVTLGYADAADTQQLSQFLATYGLYDGDVFLMDTMIAASLDGCCRAMTDRERDGLNDGLDFPLRFIQDSTGTVGILVHDADDPQYSAHFAPLRRWVSLTDGYMQVDYGLFINARSVHNSDGINLAAMKLILNKIIGE